MDHVKQHANGTWYVDIKVPARLRAQLGTNFRRTLDSKALDKKTQDRATEYIAEYLRRKRAAEEALAADALKMQKRSEEEERLRTLRTYGFDSEKDLTEFIDFCASEWPNKEVSEELFAEAVRQLTVSTRQATLQSHIENYIVHTSKRLDMARRLLDDCNKKPTTVAAAALDKTLTVSRLADRLLSTFKKTSDTERQYRAAVKLFFEYMPDKPITDVTTADARGYRDFLHERTDLTYGTCDQRLKKLRAMFNFASGEQYIPANPFSGIIISEKTKAGHGQEIDRTYIAPEILNVTLTRIIPTFPAAHSMRWPYLIMFFTGARIEEVCGLRIDEVGEHWDVNCFHIQPRPAENRTVKTSEARYIPVHKFLWNELGFCAYVAARRQEGKTLLFDFPRWRNKFYSAQFSEKMKTLRGPIETELGINLGDQHALRHNINNLLSAAGVQQEYRCMILGQATASKTNAGYGTRDATLEHLRDALHKIDLSLYDFSKLRMEGALAA